MRVISGSAGGISLSAPRDRTTRPISDRVKETLFAILAPRLSGARVLDLYAGSGAIGIEALSRGAAEGTFVEHGREALAVLRANLERTHLAGQARVAGADVMAFLQADRGVPWDLVFLDPPYALDAILAPLRLAAARLAPGGLVVVKHFWRTPVPEPGGLRTARVRRFGETSLTFLASPAAEEGEEP
jgi:16S rRNA (guanine(966)-N(2))-methyltransferase RsmD